MSRAKKLPAAVTEAIEERSRHAGELCSLIRCLEAAEAATDYGVQVSGDDLEAALRGLGRMAEELQLSLDSDNFAEAVAEIEDSRAQGAAREARGTAEAAADRRRNGGNLRVVSDSAEGPEND